VPHPDGSTGGLGGLLSYGAPGSGGRQPIAYAGPEPDALPELRDQRAPPGRRPAGHRLLPALLVRRRVVKTDVKLYGHHIGDSDPATGPETHGDLNGPFDGSIDRIAGHGTFLAGLVHQACPDAQILSWRGIPADRPLVESEWLTTLAQIHRAGPARPRGQARRPPDRRAQPVDGLLPREQGPTTCSTRSCSRS
jgi:hypothetical protein